MEILAYLFATIWNWFTMEFNVYGYNISFAGIFIFIITVGMACAIFWGVIDQND